MTLTLARDAMASDSGDKVFIPQGLENIVLHALVQVTLFDHVND